MQKQTIQSGQRYEGLDHLRGLLALTVMVYHYQGWLGWTDNLIFALQRPLTLLGLYSVSTFYCLSGAALFIVYHSRTVDLNFLREFAIKRSLRICPLFWATTTVSLALVGFAATQNDSYRVFLSYSLLFSWLDPTAYFTTGAWSIGNEWAFYTLFPFLLAAYKYRLSKYLLIIVALSVSSYYAFMVIDPTIAVDDQWSAYIDPLNQVLLFVGGIIIGSLIIKRSSSSASLPILLAASSLFVVISCLFDTPHCIHGFLRLTLAGVCLAWCYGAGTVQRRTGWMGHSLDWVGSLSYSVYLLHPVVFKVAGWFLRRLASFIPDFIWKSQVTAISIFFSAVIGTMIVAHFS